MFKTTLLAASVLLGMTACATPVPDTANNTFITDTQSAPVAFQSLRMEGQMVKGQIRRLGREPVHFGHVDYAVVDSQGNIKETGWVEHSGAIRLRHPRTPSLFSIPLKQPLKTGERVQLTYHRKHHS
ncbi:MAG TPA: hypothetical protein PLE99_10480 [Candidatus Thiothrix moscowensis]|uniref:hypothetical protein n=1 Tax=unclassified Thiothrix TaxID=2636184 RepID=UPI0025EC30B8|nr:MULTISPECIES: hypothetical protein [unclassified Thiothrix]HRJ53186.1 hypothetical protein [Candidatus Thiothrix moscowensis]HRJ93244.1 hypothetical protein [Candidatus Thiothrix moscowensis]